MSKVKQITDNLLLAGMFREAFFQGRSLAIREGDVWLELQLLEIDEGSAREKKADRFLILESPKGIEIDIKAEHYFQCAFSQFVAEWKAEIHSSAGKIRTAIPHLVEIRNHRHNGRLKTLNTKITVPVYLQTGSLHGVEFLEVQDVSKTGIGGVIVAQSGIPITPESHITGEWHGVGGIIRINGKITQARLLEQSNKEGPIRYHIGIALEAAAPLPPSISATGELQSKRKFSRQKSNHRISISSPLNPKYFIALELKDVSPAGFSANLVDPGDKHLLVLGAALKLKDSSLLAELVAMDEDLLRFQLVDGSSEDRIRWMSEAVSPANANIHRSAAQGSELIDLFCEAGAVSSQYIKNQAKLFSSLSQDLSADGLQDTWIHRWVEKSAGGAVKGHICSVRVADSCWHLGDLAGSIKEDLKISKSFIPGFFNAFREFCLSSIPCQKILLGWNNGHPYWKKFQAFFENEGKDLILGRFQTRYHRLTSKAQDKASIDYWEYNKIFASDWIGIEGVVARASSSDHVAAMHAFDFSKENFSSPNLAASIRASDGTFRREYGVLKSKKSGNEYLLVLQKFPLRASVNQTLNVPWVFPLGENRSPAAIDDFTQAMEKVRKIGITRGYYFPGILEVLESGISPASESAKVMNWHIGHPNALLFFKGKS